MEKNSLVKRLAVYKRNQERYREIYDQVKPPAADEVVELVLKLLGEVQNIETTVKSGILKGDKGDKGADGRNGVTPVADVDYLSAQACKRYITELFDKAQKNIRNGVDGKDAVVTKAQIEEAAALAYEMITLPDFDTLITKNPPAVRDALELLQGDERLEQSAIKNLPETLNELRRQRVLGDVGGGGTNTTRVRQIVLEMDTNGEIEGQGASTATEITYDNTTSGLTAVNVQEAIDELDSSIGAQGGVYVTVGFADADFICDGTDDNVQIQAAIDEVSAQGGGTVLVKNGNYSLQSSLTNLQNVVLKSAELHGSTLNFTGVPLLFVENNDKVSIEGFVLLGTTITARTGGIVWATKKTFDFTCKHNKISTDIVPIVIHNRNENYADAGNLIGNTIVDNNDFIGCASNTDTTLYAHVSPYDYSARAVIYITGRQTSDEKLEVKKNRITRGSALTQVADLNGIYIAGNSTTGIGDNLDTRIEMPIVAGNYINTLNRDAIYTSDTFRCQVIQNTIINPGRLALSCLRATYQQVKGNFIKDVPDQAFRMQLNRWSEWTDNIAINCATAITDASAAINLNRAAYNLVSDNIIDTPNKAVLIQESTTQATLLFDSIGNRLYDNIFLNNNTVDIAVNVLENTVSSNADIENQVTDLKQQTQQNILTEKGDLYVMSKNDGTVFGGVTIQNSLINFDGLSGYVNGLNALENQLEPQTIAVWMQKANNDDEAQTDAFKIFTQSFLSFSLRGENIRFGTGNNTVISVSKTSYPFDDLNLLVGEWDGTSLRFYINNNLVGTLETTLSATTNPPDIGFLGGTPTSSNYFNGLLRAYTFDKVLSTKEKALLYSVGSNELSPIRAGLVGEWSGESFVGTSGAPITILDTGNNVRALPLGENGQVLIVDAASSQGVSWTNTGLLKWSDYVLNGLVTDTTVIATGEVLTLNLNSTDYYRYITTALDANGYPTTDAIYSDFDGTNVPTGLLAQRGVV